jgi:hypothetical protein
MLVLCSLSINFRAPSVDNDAEMVVISGSVESIYQDSPKADHSALPRNYPHGRLQVRCGLSLLPWKMRRIKLYKLPSQVLTPHFSRVRIY